MKNAILVLLTSFYLGAHATIAHATPGDATTTETQIVFIGLASCNAEISGAPVQLDFFEEVSFKSNARTGNGIVVQTSFGESGIKTINRLVVQNGDGAISIEMYSAFDPNTLFANFQIDRVIGSQVEIFAIQERKVWGNFTCKSWPRLPSNEMTYSIHKEISDSTNQDE